MAGFEVSTEGKVEIFTSYSVIEETNTGRLVDLNDVNGCLETIRTLATLDRIIRHHPLFLENDIKAYANNTPSPSKFEKPPPGLQRIFFDHTMKNYRELNKVAIETKRLIVAYSDKMDAIFKKAHPQAEIEVKAKKQLPFADYWKRMAPAWAEEIADSFGVLDKVRARGVNGLLKVHSFRLLTTAQLSLAYAHFYERKRFRPGSSRDMHHVACASAVPIFVTHDGGLTRVLARMPIKGLKVIDLRTLLNRV
jgi:hypothetical protein